MIDYEKKTTNIGTVIKITKDNKELYFSRPYNSCLLISLIDAEYPSVFSVDLSDENLYYLIDELYTEIENNAGEDLFYNGIIDYHSDNFNYEYASRLIITKQDYEYRLTLFENKKEKDKKNIVVISNNSSTYGNDNVPFFKLYNVLNNYDFKTRKLVK